MTEQNVEAIIRAIADDGRTLQGVIEAIANDGTGEPISEAIVSLGFLLENYLVEVEPAEASNDLQLAWFWLAKDLPQIHKELDQLFAEMEQ